MEGVSGGLMVSVAGGRLYVLLINIINGVDRGIRPPQTEILHYYAGMTCEMRVRRVRRCPAAVAPTIRTPNGPAGHRREAQFHPATEHHVLISKTIVLIPSTLKNYFWNRV